MKKTAITLISGVLYLCLAGCGTVLLPEKAVDWLDWDRSWVTVGGMEARENNEALEAQGMSYATCSILGGMIAGPFLAGLRPIWPWRRPGWEPPQLLSGSQRRCKPERVGGLHWTAEKHTFSPLW